MVFSNKSLELFENVFFHSRIDAINLPTNRGWEPTQRLATSVLNLDVSIDEEGILHLAYLLSGDENQDQAGIYYTHTLDNQLYWTSPINLYQSPYFRTLAGRDSANIDIAISAGV